jgi:O-antigen ligase
MLGRHAIAVEMAQDIDSRPLVESLIGYGPGSANALATLVSDGTLSEPHNDWLKILYDYGILGSAIITIFIALVFSSSPTGAVIALANAIMMTTDNVIIYLYYQFPIVLMVAYSVMRDSRASETANAPAANLIKARQE